MNNIVVPIDTDKYSIDIINNNYDIVDDIYNDVNSKYQIILNVNMLNSINFEENKFYDIINNTGSNINTIKDLEILDYYTEPKSQYTIKK